MGVCEILDVSEKCAGQCPACLGSGVDGRLYDLRLCSENLGEEETLELESGRKRGPVAPQAASRATEGTVGTGGIFSGSRQADQTLLWKGPWSAHLPGLLQVSEEACAGLFSMAGLANPFSPKDQEGNIS